MTPREAETPETPETGTAPEPEAVPPRRERPVRAAMGFLSFFLGITLTLGSLGALGDRYLSERGAEADWSGDWQNTQIFRDEVSRSLVRLLNWASGGALDWDLGYYDPLAETLGAAAPVEAESPAPSGDLREDRNVLYSVWRSGRCLDESGGLTNDFYVRALEGYNFYLTFRDGRVTAYRDGAELDVYGDGVYDADSLWTVPGYDNLPAPEDLADVTVYLAVRTEPVQYYSRNGQAAVSRMYTAARRAEEARTFLIRHLVLLVLGALWLLAWGALRRERRLWDERIAAWTGHVWTEVWALLALALLGWLAVLALPVLRDLYRLGREMWWSGSMDWGTLLLGVARALLSGYPALLALGWLLWLFCNDRRHNPRERRRGLLRTLLALAGKLLRRLGALARGLVRGLQARDLERPVERRLARDNTLTLTALLIGFLISLPVICMAAYLWLFSAGNRLPYFLLLVPFCLLEALPVLTIVRVFRGRRLAWDLGRLSRQIESIRAGDLTTPLDLPEDADLRKMAEALNGIQSGMKTALAEQTRSERMKVELISNVSHDLKTPLTSILSYAELLRQEDLPPAAADYARILDEKAQRLKAMVQDVFEVSKAAADQLPVHLERLDLAKLLRQTLADLADPIRDSGLTLRTDLPEEPVEIRADGARLYRVFQNLIDNALRYALPGSRVYLTLQASEGRAETSVRNTSREELPEGVDFTARFVRGDESRTDGGSGLGLSIASSFTEACGGAFRVETVADLFTAVVTFPLAGEEPEG